MTLRARLTAAFLAVVLGPVLLGAVFVGVTVAAVGNARSTERLDVAAAGVRGSLNVLCQRLRAAAESAALMSASSRPETVQQVVDRGFAAGIEVTRPDGLLIMTVGTPGPRPWVDCGGSGRAAAAVGAVGAVIARVEVRATSGQVTGYATATEAVDGGFVARLAEVAGAEVTVLGAGPASSTEDGEAIDQVPALAHDLDTDETGETLDGRYVRRLDPEPGQPLALALSVEGQARQGLYATLVAVVLCAGLVAVSAAWWLARSTTRPLTELAYTVERVAAGDLGARVSVRSQDEVGRLGATFNRMTREMQGYVQALTASRDQLRGQLGILGDTLSSTHDINRILQVILETAMAATGAQAGVVLLADPVTGTLVGQCGHGLTERCAGDVSELLVRPGEGLLGQVTASGDPRRGRVDRDGPVLTAHEPRCRTYVAVPFSGPGGAPNGTTGVLDSISDGGPPSARGVLALYDRHGFDEFDDSDLVTLRTFAGQAAVALDNVRVHEEAQRLSLTDPLTGLSNYRYLKESLRREVERASRFGRTLAVLVLDLDRFKEVNDTYGHAAGDAVLAEFARRVRAEIREVDFAFRQGGEEFVVLLPETDPPGGAVVAQRLGAAVRRTPVVIMPGSERGEADEPLRVSVSVSIGVAVFPDHGETGVAVLRAADDALYQAKAAGRDTYRLAAPPPAERLAVPPSTPSGAVDPAALGASRGAQPPRQSRGG